MAQQRSPTSSPSCSKPSNSSQSPGSGYQKRETRISKDNLYMALALWMEKFPSRNKEGVPLKAKKVGVVFVLPTDRVLTADCSRDGVHGVARVIMKHNDKLRGCEVFVSRKPCSLCTKLLIQAKVSRIFYLPIEPESIETENELERVDNLFKVSPVGQSVFVPCIEDKVLDHVERKLPGKITPNDVDECRNKLYEEWWSDEWVKKAGGRLHHCLNSEMRDQVKADFRALMKWLAGIKLPLDKGVQFRKIRYDEKADKIMADSDEYLDAEMAKVMIIFAKMLARQTDDPKTGVGAVIVKEREVMALGWNGYPSKALYGEFPRASDDDDEAAEKKYPFVIHAEQNALMLRNTTDLSGGVLFVTKTPCDECVPLLMLSGINTVIVGEEIGKSHGVRLSYGLIKEYIKTPSFQCYEMTSIDKGQMSDPKIRKRLFSRTESVTN